MRAKSTQLATGKSGQLKIGALPSIAAELLPRVIASFRKDFPDVHLEIVEAVDQDLVAAIKAGRCDVCLTSARMLERGMSFQKLFSDELMAVMRKGHPLAGRKEVQISELANEGLILTKSGTSLRLAINQAFSDEGLVVFPSFEVTNIATVIAFAVEGLGIALVPKSSVRHIVHPDMVAIRVGKKSGARTMGILQMDGTMSYPLQQQFIKVVKAVSVSELSSAPGSSLDPL